MVQISANVQDVIIGSPLEHFDKARMLLCSHSAVIAFNRSHPDLALERDEKDTQSLMDIQIACVDLKIWKTNLILHNFNMAYELIPFRIVKKDELRFFPYNADDKDAQNHTDHNGRMAPAVSDRYAEW